MRAGILLGLATVFLFVLGFGSIAEALVQENVLVIEKGPLNFSSEKRRYSINFEVTEEQLRDCKVFYLYVGIRGITKGLLFNCHKSINGSGIGGSTTADTDWFIGGNGLTGENPIKVGTNQIVLESVKEDSGIQYPATFNGQAAGIVVYFSKDKNENVGLLDYIPYSAPILPNIPNQEPSDQAPSPKEAYKGKFLYWATGIVHEHSTNSDGSFSLGERFEQAKDFGYDFVICTDHYEQIDKPIKAPGLYYEWATYSANFSVGFSNYVKSCQNVTRDGSFVAIAGAEINTPWYPSPSTKVVSNAHTLCLGDIRETDAINALQSKEGKQAEVIAAINEIGLSVAAHPNLTSLKSVSLTPWEGIHFRYNCLSSDKYAKLNGVEIGNTITPDQDDADMAFFMRLMKEHHPAFPTGGCDSHGWGDKEDVKRLKRLTGVFVEQLTKPCILIGMKQGKVYASADGVRIIDCNPIPSFSPIIMEKARFSFNLAGLPQKVLCQMYRDGEPIKDSKKVVSPESPTYEWADENSSTKEAWYNFRVLPNYLITAPIVLKLKN